MERRKKKKEAVHWDNGEVLVFYRKDAILVVNMTFALLEVMLCVRMRIHTD